MSDCTKCRVVNGVVHLCKTLLAGLEDTGRKGVSVLELVDTRTLQTTRTAIVLRSGDFAKRGLVINFCPFCGEHISSQFEEDLEKARAEAATT